MTKHINGKRHQRAVELAQRQEDHAAKAVYVRGFDPNIQEASLGQFFSTFGEVKRLFLNKEAQYAIVEYASSEMARHVLSMPQLCMGRHRLRVRPRSVKLQPHRPRKQHHKPDTGAAGPTGKLGQQGKGEEGAKNAVDHDVLMAQLLRADTVDGQMSHIQQSLELSMDDILQRGDIQHELQNLLQQFIPGCEVHQFGSSVNGCGVKGCDMDLLLELNLDKPHLHLSKQRREHPTPYFGDFPMVIQCNDLGHIHVSCIEDMDLSDRIKLVSRIVSTVSKGRYNDMLTISTARCPVVKFTHTASQIHCDLSINNRLALQNTRLLQLYTKRYPGVRTLLYTVRYWAKYKQLAGNVTSGPRLTNYALTLLVLHYLANCEPPVIPSVNTLAQAADHKEMIESWDCSFSTDPSVLSPSTTTPQALSVTDLLTGFYQFYDHYDLIHKVVVTRETPVDLFDFQKAMDADDMLKTFKVSPLRVQDPFVLSHNTTQNVNDKTFQLLLAELKHACHVCSSPAFSKPVPGADKWGIPLLLSSAAVDLPVEPSTSETKSQAGDMYSFELSVASWQLAVKQYSSSNEECLTWWCHRAVECVLRVLKEVLYVDVDIVQGGLEHSGSAAMLDMEKPLVDGKSCMERSSQNGATADDDDDCSPAKRQKLSEEIEEQLAIEPGDGGSEDIVARQSDHIDNGKSSEHPEDQVTDTSSSQTVDKGSQGAPCAVKLKAECSTRYRMWMGRKKAKKNLIVSDDFLEAEITTSLNMADLTRANQVVLTFDLELTQFDNLTEGGVKVTASPNHGANEFKVFFPFLRTFLLKAIDKSKLCD